MIYEKITLTVEFRFCSDFFTFQSGWFRRSHQTRIRWWEENQCLWDTELLGTWDRVRSFRPLLRSGFLGDWSHQFRHVVRQVAFPVQGWDRDFGENQTVQVWVSGKFLLISECSSSIRSKRLHQKNPGYWPKRKNEHTTNAFTSFHIKRFSWLK